jgi:branched-subunit amino acid ABC-type transport system permease component
MPILSGHVTWDQFFLLLGTGVVDAAILAPACLGFSLQFGITNYVNFAYGGAMTFASFMAWTFGASKFHLGFVQYILVAALLTGAASFLIGVFLYTPFYNRRPQLLYLLVLTFATGLILDSLYVVIWGEAPHVLAYPAGADITHYIGPFLVTNLELIFIAVSIVILAAVYALLQYTALGKIMRAMADDRSLAVVCGLPINFVSNTTWFITGFLAGIAGVVLGLHSYGFDTTLGDGFVYLVFAAVIIGGIGRSLGAVVGAVIIGLVFELSSLIVGSALTPVAVFACLVVIMLFRPEGLLGATGRSAFSRA